jgi:hypothetical protein
MAVTDDVNQSHRMIERREYQTYVTIAASVSVRDIVRSVQPNASLPELTFSPPEHKEVYGTHNENWLNLEKSIVITGTKDRLTRPRVGQDGSDDQYPSPNVPPRPTPLIAHSPPQSHLAAQPQNPESSHCHLTPRNTTLLCVQPLLPSRCLHARSRRIRNNRRRRCSRSLGSNIPLYGKNRWKAYHAVLLMATVVSLDQKFSMWLMR